MSAPTSNGMEHLTKQQIVLVTLLVSFVTSIATGVVTVSLMDQAPVGVTQTINKVVERTIERVVPAEIPAQKATIKETIVVKADDQVVSAVARVKPSIVRISAYKPNETELVFLGLGLIVTNEGHVLTDRNLFIENAQYVGLNEKKSYSLKFLGNNGNTGSTLFQIEVPRGESASFTPALLGTGESLSLGQSIISVGGGMTTTVSTGIVSGLIENSTASSTISAIKTGISSPDETLGSVLLNLMGEVVGIRVGLQMDDTKGLYLPIDSVKQYIPAATATSQTR